MTINNAPRHISPTHLALDSGTDIRSALKVMIQHHMSDNTSNVEPWTLSDDILEYLNAKLKNPDPQTAEALGLMINFRENHIGINPRTGTVDDKALIHYVGDSRNIFTSDLYIGFDKKIDDRRK